MPLSQKAKQTLIANITVLEELPIERIPAVIGGQKPEEISVLYRQCRPVEITREYFLLPQSENNLAVETEKCLLENLPERGGAGSRCG